MRSGREARPRATKMTVERRIDDLIPLVVAGTTARKIREFVRASERRVGGAWHPKPGDRPLTRCQIRRYVLKAIAFIRESLAPGRRLRIRLHLARLRFLYLKCVQVGDYRTALAILKDEANLLGLYPGQVCRCFRGEQ